ncbi:MAG TPA: heavy metal translocating P-type ATPase [Cyclobacteriaceae bacterium]
MLSVNQTKSKAKCFHCGDYCDEENIRFDDKAFCCHGCRSVYEILSVNQLTDYYSYQERPGIKVNSEKEATYNFLENEEIQSQLLDFKDENTAKITLSLPYIHCSSCIWLLENLARLNGGIIHSSVNFVKKEASIIYKPQKITLAQLANLLNSIGYPPDISLSSSKGKTKPQSNQIIGKLAVAGFCFGNSMLISLPAYFDNQQLLTSDFKWLFGILNILLSIPVVFYSAQEYFISAWKGIKNKIINIDIPIALGISVLFIRSVSEILFFSGEGYVDSLCGLVFFLLIGKWYQGKTYTALSFDRDYESYFPIAVTKLNGGVEQSVSVKSVRQGDRILIHNKELIPVDGTLEEGNAHVDYSFVTGESLPVDKSVGDLIYAGGRHMGTPITLKVKKSVDQSYLTQLWNQDIFSKPDESHLTNLINRVSKYFTVVVILIALVSGGVWYFIDLGQSLSVVTSVLIVACPCALALSVPFTYGHTLRIFGRKNFYLKNSAVVEKIASIKSIIFDKTGTLTHALPEKLNYQGENLTGDFWRLVMTACRNSTHPLSQIIYKNLKGNYNLLKLDSFFEIEGKGIKAKAGSNELLLGSAAFVKNNSQNINETIVFVKINDEIKGAFTFETKYRNGFDHWLTALKNKYDIHLLSGDNSRDGEFLKPYFKSMSFNQSPEDKLQYISNVTDGQTMMVGDGLNDAGALKKSDVGISITENVSQFSPACDAIIQSDSISNLPEFLRFSRMSKVVVTLAIIVSLLYNVVGLSFAISGYLTPLVAAILMPISSVTTVVFITLMINYLSKRHLQ